MQLFRGDIACFIRLANIVGKICFVVSKLLFKNIVTVEKNWGFIAEIKIQLYSLDLDVFIPQTFWIFYMCFQNSTISSVYLTLKTSEDFKFSCVYIITSMAFIVHSLTFQFKL